MFCFYTRVIWGKQIWSAAFKITFEADRHALLAEFLFSFFVKSSSFRRFHFLQSLSHRRRLLSSSMPFTVLFDSQVSGFIQKIFGSRPIQWFAEIRGIHWTNFFIFFILTGNIKVETHYWSFISETLSHVICTPFKRNMKFLEKHRVNHKSKDMLKWQVLQI